MESTGNNPPIILTFAALDPSGTGGLQADIETAASLGCHCAPVATTLVAEGVNSNAESHAVSSTLLISQARSVLENMNVATIKLGFLGSVANVEAVHTILRDYASIPVVAHPTLYIWDKMDEQQSGLADALFTLIFPLVKVGIFSVYEARVVSRQSDTIATTAQAIAGTGCEYTLITGTGEAQPNFRNSSYSQKGLVEHYNWEQEPPTCHGTSTTLTMSTAAYLAHSGDPLVAIQQAQNFTWQTIRAARPLGYATHTPHRFFWADKNIESCDKIPTKTKNH
ncbi:bifunctional hydroxymethylpyrimidine kinase/phosphomethylpyrimidine kinase [Teredinibacter turnerae]|uniref:bifunctional hydroxymethylpyrimidine kinase/phosphomethylpyrimidine kinase n=1 Tax=Teredinibacter turnerae TaxID=2426 RepID=UPI000360BFA3|nr:hydroxymethylpyrimidine/phosphomethylpyrimidine kinase [Teredinibacter turnerae]